MRPFTAQLLANLADTEEEEDNTEENEVNNNEEKSAMMIRQMLTTAAGFYSADLHTQKKVEQSIASLIPALPTLLSQCQHNQAVLAAMQEHTLKKTLVESDRESSGESDNKKAKRGEAGADDMGREYIGTETVASMRARVLKTLIEHPTSTFSTSVFEDMRLDLDCHLSQLRHDLALIEEETSKEIREKQGASGGQNSSAFYLTSMHRAHYEKAKVAIPSLLSMSDEVEIDFLELSDDHLVQVLNIPELSGVKKAADAILQTVHSHRQKIIDEEQPPSALRTVPSLSSFLSGSAQRGVGSDHSLMKAACAVAKGEPCRSSKWWHSLDSAWSWLVSTCKEWEEFESRVRRALKKRSTEDDFAALKKLLDELKSSSLVNDKLRGEIAARLQSIANLALADGDIKAEKHRGEEKCRKCRVRQADLRYFPSRFASTVQGAFCLANVKWTA